jgi:hypothetical protein
MTRKGRKAFSLMWKRVRERPWTIHILDGLIEHVDHGTCVVLCEVARGQLLEYRVTRDSYLVAAND